MTGSDQKFWIGIASAFILPTMAYIYTQGMTAQSINQLAKSVDKFQSTVDIINDRVNTIANGTSNNNISLSNLDSHVKKLDVIVNEQSKKIVILETQINNKVGR